MLARPAKCRFASSPSTVYERLEQMGGGRKYLVNSPGKAGADPEDHARILDAIRRRHPAEAERIVRRLIRRMRSALSGALR